MIDDVVETKSIFSELARELKKNRRIVKRWYEQSEPSKEGNHPS
jgi:transposase-like protein